MTYLSRWLLSFGIGLSALAQVQAAPPQTRVVTRGLDARAEILIDPWGVPHIYASTHHDAFFAQGWNAARDRLWQIDLWRRSGLGELSAVLGSAYVAQDRATRLFVYRGNMEQEWASYGPDAKKDTEAFVAGINAYVVAAKGDAKWMPREFTLAGYEPAFWKADDIVRIRNHGLAFGASMELMRAQIACSGGMDAAEFIPKISPPWNPVIPEGLDLCSIPPNVLDQYHLAQKPVIFAKPEQQTATEPYTSPAQLADNIRRGLSQGSNNWAIAPSKSATGRPILANDPHRSDEVPSLRYLAHIVAPGMNVIGAGEPALPGISIGHNERIAFGITVFLIAQEDLYIYETNPQNPNEYRYMQGWESFRVVHEAMAVSRGPQRDVELKFTRHGPVVLEDPEHHRAYAVRAAWLDTGGAPYLGSLRYLQAHNIKEFAAALKYWGEPGENQLYADTAGRIAWFPAGMTPIRANSDGILPLPGDGRYEWGGYLDRDLLPSEIDPTRGYIATANQMDLPEGYPYADRRVSFYWPDDIRFRRITEVLSGSSAHSIVGSEELQNDYLSLPAGRLIGVLNTISTANPQLTDLIHWLATWDRRITANSAQAALFEVWIAHHLGSEVIGRVVPSAPEGFGRLFSGTASEIVDLMEHPDRRLGVDPDKTRDEIMLNTLAAAYEETNRLLGTDRLAWQWGRLATALFEHPLSKIADDSERSMLNVGPLPKAGDSTVVGAAVYRNGDFRLQAGASFRMVLDVGHWDDSVAVNTPGQSGDPTSPHYRDLFNSWLFGKYFPLLYSKSAIEKAAERKILLEPR